jgi:hypothetical protein
MDTTTATLLAGSVVVIGRWVQDKPVNFKVIVGIVGAALIVSLIGQADEGLARGFGLLFLVSMLFNYALPILRKVGLIK